MHKDIVCGLDIGASSIRAIVIQTLAGEEKILGHSESTTKGFSKGVVSNLNLLSDVIEETLAKVEGKAHCRVRKVIANISGVHIRTFKSRGSIHISDRPSEIAERDLKRCIESAKLIAMSLDREVVHLIPERFYIDDKMDIDDPLGLFGSKLDVDLNIVTSLVSILQNLTKAINLAGYEVEDVILSGMATALAIFEQKELEEGAVLIDVGKDLTEATLFMNNKLQDCFYFPFGSDDLTQVLQDRLRIMFKEAEKLRIKYGIVMPGSGQDDARSDQSKMGGNWVDSEVVEAGSRSFGDSARPTVVSRREISNILFPKVEEIMQDVYKKIEPFLRQKKKLPRVCVSGGISRMDGFVESVEDIFSVPVDMARIVNATQLHDNSFACAVGLARHGAKKKLERRSKYAYDANSFTGRVFSRVRSVLAEYF